MTDEYIKHEIEKLKKDMNAYLTQVAFTNPERLPSAMLEVMCYRMRLEMLHGIIGFLEAFMDKLDKQNKGR